MANTITKHTIFDGVKHLVIKIVIEGDGSGDESKTNLINASDYFEAPEEVFLNGINSALNGFTAKLYWDADADVIICGLPDYFYKFKMQPCYPEIPNNAGSGKTGDILISTSSLGSGDHGTIFFFLTKK